MRSLILGSLVSLFTYTSALAQKKEVSMLDLSAIDTSTSPCDDFYQYSCGNWIKNTELPADKSILYRSFSTLRDKSSKTLQDILEAYSKGNIDPKVPYANKLGGFYGTCMDEAQIEKVSKAELTEQLQQVDALQNREDLPMAVAKLHLKSTNVFFDFNAAADLSDPDMQIAEFSQGGMGLPNSTYYTKTDAVSVATLKRYQEYITKMFELAGYAHDDASANAITVVDIETALAKNALPPEEQMDPVKLYHPLKTSEFQENSKAFDWSSYYKALNIAPPKIINVTELKFLEAVNTVVNQFPLEQLRQYFKWHVLQKLAPHLDKAFASESFEFEDHYLQGQKTNTSRAERCEQTVENYMGDALGHAYIQKNFSPNAKKRVVTMMDNILKAFGNNLRKADWLDNETRKAALEKLSLVTVRVGYPDKWISFDPLTITADSYLNNVIAAATYSKVRDLQKIGKPTDQSEWRMFAQTVNANYEPTSNSIEFPAGILQPPFFSEEANDAENYGSIGMVMGHELTHGFDTSGSQFDGHGVMKNWWTKVTLEKFQAKAQCLSKQYSSYSVLPGVNVNGDLTITENIADAGGIKIAHAAYELAKASSSSQSKIVDKNGFSDSQQFMLSFAQAWCAKASDEYMRKLVNENPHSPPRFRVIGVTVNDVEFPNAFTCPEGKCPMSPAERCAIW